MNLLLLTIVSIACFCPTLSSGFVVPDAPVIAPSTQQQTPTFHSSVVTQTVQQQQFLQGGESSPFQNGIRDYMLSSSSSSPSLSSSMTLSLKDRPPPPTAEELAAKKRNFNLWFWGGGFVAPFLATFYYFGLKFWER